MSQADDFAGKMQSLLGVNPFDLWTPTTPTALYAPFADSSDNKGTKQVNLIADRTTSPMLDSLKSALNAVNPFSSFSPTQTAVAKAVGDVGTGAKKALQAAGNAVESAGGGITSGFRYLTIFVVGLVLLYLFVIFSPYIPKPGKAAA